MSPGPYLSQAAASALSRRNSRRGADHLTGGGMKRPLIRRTVSSTDSVMVESDVRPRLRGRLNRLDRVRDLYEGFAAGDRDHVADMLAEDFTFFSPVDVGESRRGQGQEHGGPHVQRRPDLP